MPKSRFLLLTLFLAAVAAAADAGEIDIESVAAAQGLSGEVFSVDELTLEMGPGRLHIASGRLYAAEPIGGVSREFVLVGDARFQLDPPDEIERGQLEFFTGAREVDEGILSAVLVIANDAALSAIASRPLIEASVAETSLARSTYSSWRNSPERRVLAVEPAILRDLHGDPAYSQYFCAWMFSRERGRIVYLVDPEAREQVTLGRFERVQLTQRERRKIQRQLHREQRQGRLIGADVDQLGRFDTWVSMHMPSPEGLERSGGRPLDVQHYGLELEVQRDARLAQGKAAIELRARRATNVLRFGLDADLSVAAVEVDGARLQHLSAAGELLAFLPEPLEPGDTLTVEVTYSGALIDRQGSSAVVASTLDWYPNTGTDDRATFEVLFRWPKRFDLLSSGAVVESGEDKDWSWQRSVLRRPSSAFGFEVGKFRTESFAVRGIPVTFATDYQGRLLTGSGSRESLIASVSSALEFCIEAFGSYPYEQLTLVTTGRNFSQSLPGFITLSSLMLADDTRLALYSGLRDPRGLIAHEVAHQWWGHKVAFAGFREAWLSEGMADYAATLYVRRNVPDLRFGRGPTSGWRLALSEQLDDGTTIEQVGPLSLGRRLNSSRADAYQPIVYKKGALVLGMLARGVGEERFLEALKILIDFVDERDLEVSSEDFVALLGRITQQDLDRFAEQFVFATGLPSIDFEFEAAAADEDEGGWWVRVQIARSSHLGFRYDVVRAPSGGLDVHRRVLSHIESPDAPLYLPFRIITVADEETGRTPQEARSGLLTLNDQSMSLEVQMDDRPLGFELDPHDEVFALTRNLGLYPKRRQLTRGLEALGAGDRTAARTAFEEVLTSPAWAGAVRLAPNWIADERDALDARAHRELCRLELAAGNLEAAQQYLQAAAETMSFRDRRGIRFRVLEARIALRRGQPMEAHKLLAKDVQRQQTDNLEAVLVFAIAAEEAGLAGEARTALARLDSQPVDVGLLAQRTAG